MNIAVVGTGYVGLVTGTCLAETGNNVTCVDIDAQKIRHMQAGTVPIYEPQLDVLFHRNIDQGRLRFTTHLTKAVAESMLIFLALPTPAQTNGSADVSHILKVAENIGKLIKNYTIILNKSTVPVGTAEKVRELIKRRTQTAFDVVSNPEFLREGFAVEDFMKPDRIVIGTRSEKAREILDQLYRPYVRQGNPILFMDERSAELTKYAANAFLATKISFINEIANLCEQVHADVDQVRIALGTDERIGKRFLLPGIGYGGSCFPKDVQALIHTAEAHNYDFKTLRAVMQVNTIQRTLLLPKIKAHFNGSLRGLKLALWGLSFKPDTDDIREAPALCLLKKLLEAGVTIAAHDPAAMKNVRKSLGNTIQYASEPYQALEQADALVILTEWSVFRSPDFKKIGQLLKNKVIFDGRNLYSPHKLEQQGFHYYSIGRATVHPQQCRHAGYG